MIKDVSFSKEKLIEKPLKLIIIGNGFDLAHKLRTNYSSFAANVHDPALEQFKKMCEKLPQIDDWTRFEENINAVVDDYYTKAISECFSNDEAIIRLMNINNVFGHINSLLKNYLKKETEKSVQILDSLKDAFSGKVSVLNFNYTNTVKKYTNEDVIYVHGSINEDDIVLGYDGQIKYCLTDFDECKWNKHICRQNLAFRRMLREKRLREGTKEYIDKYNAFLEYQKWSYSGRGAEDIELKNKLPYYDRIHQFIMQFDEIPSETKIPYEYIKYFYVIGHGLKADKEYLDSILNRCTNLKGIYLYSYKNEDENSYREKEEFLKKYSKVIKKNYY